MTTLVYGATTPDGERRYVRLETERTVRWGTIPDELLETPVITSAERAGTLSLSDLDGHYAEELRERFVEQPLEGLINEFTTRTPYSREEAAVVVTRGWFEMDTASALRAINQHVRDPYEELSTEEFTDHVTAARQRRSRIQNTNHYPFGL